MVMEHRVRAVTASVEQAMVDMHSQSTLAPSARATSDENLFQRIWPKAFVAFALAVNLAWVALLGYGVISLVRLAF